MNAQQKLEKQIRTLRSQLKTLSGKVAIPATKESSGNDMLEALNHYLNKPSIIKSFGKATVLKVEDSTYTRKDGTITPIKRATLSTGTVFNLSENRFWKA